MRLARLTAAQLGRIEHREAFGAMLEAFATAEILRQSTWSETPFGLYHYRDRDGTEVDLVLEFDDGSVVGVEVKSATSFNAAQFPGLARMRDRLGSRFLAGVVLNTGTTGYRYADRLFGAPLASLWEPWTTN